MIENIVNLRSLPIRYSPVQINALDKEINFASPSCLVELAIFCGENR